MVNSSTRCQLKLNIITKLFVPILPFLTATYQKYLFPELVTTSKIILFSIPTASILVLALVLSHFCYRRHLLTRCFSSSSASTLPKCSVTMTPEHSLTIILIRASLLQGAWWSTTAPGNLLGKESSASKFFFPFLILYYSLAYPLPLPGVRFHLGAFSGTQVSFPLLRVSEFLLFNNSS